MNGSALQAGVRVFDRNGTMTVPTGEEMERMP